MSRPASRNTAIPDEYPARPTSMLRHDIQTMNSKIEKNETCSLIILCITYFIFGCGLGFYGPLYPREAKLHDMKIYLYGPAIAVNFLASILFYPIACRMVPSITCRQSISTSIIMIAVCKVLFGTLALVSAKIPFIILSYGIQVIEGIGVAVLLASTFVKIFSQVTDKTGRNIGAIQLVLVFGLAVGSICGEALNDALGFNIPFYGVGVLFFLNGIAVAVFLPEPDVRMNHTEMPVLSWTRKPRLLIYFLVVFTTLNYTGFLVVVLEPYLRQFHLNKVFIGVLFSIPPLACGISAPAWKWITKKGVNSILLICFSCLLIFASLILIGPAPFTNIKVSLLNVSIALLLKGLGIGGKLACVTFAAKTDMRCFSGSLTAGFTLFYFGMGQATYILFGLEAITIAICFVFAFKRNYTSLRHTHEPEETQPILES